LSRIPIEDEDSYGARQWAMETAGDDMIEDIEEREREREAEEFGSTPFRRQIAVGESAEFLAKYAQQCRTCRKVIPVGEMARGRKRERGWDLFHLRCIPD
jgi:hypothetical protein